MKYIDFNVNYEQPDVWRKPVVSKFKVGKSYKTFLQEILDFEKLKEDAAKEIVTTISKNIEASNNKDELNSRLDNVFDFYSKAIIPTEDINESFLLKKTNKNTLNKKLQPWCKNLNYNIKDVWKAKSYDELGGKFKDVPAFVCLAGPSLKNNRELLKKAKGKSIIIAVDTSLRPLLDIGVVPDICVTHDANPNGCKFFLSKDHPLNVNNVQLNDLKDDAIGLIYAQLMNDKERLKFSYDTLGLFVNYCHPLTLLTWNGREKRFYGVTDPSLPVYDCMAGACDFKHENGHLVEHKKGRIVGGSSVGHVATYAAVFLGCNPISFLGLDLSYPGGKTYIEGASNQKDMKNQKLVDMEDLSGNKVQTNISMLSYKMVFERSLPHIILQTNRKFYNCTEDDKGNPTGILEVGAYPKSLSWVIENHCNKDIDVKGVLNNDGTEKK